MTVLTWDDGQMSSDEEGPFWFAAAMRRLATAPGVAAGDLPGITDAVRNLGEVVSEDSPVAWLRAQIEARKALAVAACGRASRPPGWVVRAYPNGVMICRDVDAQPVVYEGAAPSDAEAAHMAANGPRDVIAACDAELAILDEHAPEFTDYIDGDGIERGSRECTTCYPGGTPDNYPCRTVRLLAGGYRYRPGYREQDWKA